MACTESKWYLYTKRADFDAIAARYGIDKVTARILRNRDICTEEEIRGVLFGTLEDLYDERQLPDMDKAARILYDAVCSGQYIRVVGDYDIDGVLATCILLRGLKRLGARVDHRIPDRINDGYGINEKIVRESVDAGVDLILTCDNGIAAIDELKIAAEQGLTVLVTDHHNVRKDEEGRDILPPAEAVADPKREGSAYPTTEICGAVIAWKLIRCLYRLAGLPPEAWFEFLDLAAIATVGDIMPLRGENRIIVKEGLRIMNGGKRPDTAAGGNCSGAQYGSSDLGLRTLIRRLHLDDREINAYHIGFVIGPCINAGGRLETAEAALRLFMSEDPREAEDLADHLIQLNNERKTMTEAGVAEGIRIVEERYASDKVLVVCIEDLHESLAGIVAGRLREYFGKPAIVITPARDGLKGSGRSIEAYDMFAGLCGAESLMTRFGGHTMAAGLSLPRENLEALRQRLNEQADLDAGVFVKKIWIDVPMPIGYVTLPLIEELEKLGPYGQGFEQPLFARKDVRFSDLRVLGKNRNVLRMRLWENNGAGFAGTGADGIMFGDADALEAELRNAESIDILYYPKINSYNGRRTVQIQIRDCKVHEG